jgi:prophage regulatory protein
VPSPRENDDRTALVFGFAWPLTSCHQVQGAVMVDADKEIDKQPPSPGKKQRSPERNRNAENHGALLAAVGEMVALSAPARVRRISLYSELKVLGIHYSRRHLDRLEAEEKFPKRVALGEGRIGWVTAEIIAHVDKQIESRSLAAGTLGSGDLCRRAKRKAEAVMKKLAESGITFEYDGKALVACARSNCKTPSSVARYTISAMRSKVVSVHSRPPEADSLHSPRGFAASTECAIGSKPKSSPPASGG